MKTFKILTLTTLLSTASMACARTDFATFGAHFDRMQQHMQNMMKEMQDAFTEPSQAAPSTLTVEDKDDSVVLKINAAGLDKVEATVENKTLSIEALKGDKLLGQIFVKKGFVRGDFIVTEQKEEKKEDADKKESQKFVSYSSYHDSFARHIPPVEIEAKNINIEYKDGVITVVLPKSPEAARKVAVKTDITVTPKAEPAQESAKKSSPYSISEFEEVK